MTRNSTQAGIYIWINIQCKILSTKRKIQWLPERNLFRASIPVMLPRNPFVGNPCVLSVTPWEALRFLPANSGDDFRPPAGRGRYSYPLLYRPGLSNEWVGEKASNHVKALLKQHPPREDSSTWPTPARRPPDNPAHPAPLPWLLDWSTADDCYSLQVWKGRSMDHNHRFN